MDIQDPVMDNREETYLVELQYNIAVVIQNKTRTRNILSPDVYFLTLWAQLSGILLVTSLTVAGNAVVILSIVCTGGHRKATNCLILCLAAVDLIIGLIFPVSLATYLLGKWPWSYASCQIFSFVSNVCLDASMMATLFITLDRWWSIYKPFIYRTTQSRKRAVLSTLSAWLTGVFIYAFAYAAWNMWGSRYPEEHCNAPFIRNIAFTFTISMLELIVPTTLVFYCNLSVYTKIRSRKDSKVRRSVSSTSDHHSSCVSMYLDDAYGLRGRRSPRRSSVLYSDLLNELQRSRRHSVIYRSAPSPTRSLDAGLREPMLGHCSSEPDASSMLDKRRIFHNRRISFDTFMSEQFRRFRRQSSSHLLSLAPSVRKNSDALVKEMLEKQNRKAARALALLVSVFLLCWCPYTFIKAIRPLVTYMPAIVVKASEWLCYFNSTLNPLLHILGNASFARRLRAFLGIERKPMTLLQMAKRTTTMTEQQQAFIRSFARRSTPPSSNGLLANGHIPEDIAEHEIPE